MSAGSGMPVMRFVVENLILVILVRAELSHTGRAVSVAVGIIVMLLCGVGKRVSAGDRIPVIVLIGSVTVFGVISVVAYLILTDITNAVVANLVYVSCKVDCVYTMTAGYSVPVTGLVARPVVAFCPGVSAEYVLTYVTDAVVISGVNVILNVDGSNCVTAASRVVVVVLVVRPILCIKAMLTVLTANGTYAVVILVVVKRLEGLGNYVGTFGELKPVMSCVKVILVLALRMLTELIETNIADTVVVLVTVGVESLKLCGNLVLALGKLKPVVSLVRGVDVLALRMLTYLISAHVTSAVVSFNVGMLCFILLIVFYVMSTYGGMPMRCSAFLVCPSGIVKLVLAELIVTNVADAVVAFFVNVIFNGGGVI